MSPAATTVRRGRPRRAEVDRVIHAAAREMLADGGYGRLTIEGVAKRAGVGKPTVYRRYDSKASLVAAALVEVLETVNPEAPDTGDPADDAKQLLGNLAHALSATDFGRSMTEIVSPAARETHLAELFDSAVQARRTLIRAVLQRAADQGRLVPTSVEVAIDLLLGAIYFRHLISHEPLDEQFVADIVESVVTETSDLEATP